MAASEISNTVIQIQAEKGYIVTPTYEFVPHSVLFYPISGVICPPPPIMSIQGEYVILP